MASAGASDSGGSSAGHQATPWWEVDPAVLPETVRAELEMVQDMAAAQFDLADAAVASWVERATKLCAGTLLNLKKEGKLFAARRRLGVVTLPPPPPTWDQEARRLIAVTAEIAAPRFVTEKAIEWLPEQAALATFFINCSLFDFEKVYKAFCREETPKGGDLVYVREDGDGENVVTLFGAAPEPGPEACALDRVTVFEAMTLMGDPLLAKIIMRLASGMTRIQVAAELGISTKKIYRVLEEFREKLNERGFDIRKGREN